MPQSDANNDDENNPPQFPSLSKGGEGGFNPFPRTEPLRDRHKGGLGLPVARLSDGQGQTGGFSGESVRRKVVKRKVNKRRSLKTRLRNKLTKSLIGKTKLVYIVIAVIISITIAYMLMSYILREEPPTPTTQAL